MPSQRGLAGARRHVVAGPTMLPGPLVSSRHSVGTWSKNPIPPSPRNVQSMENTASMSKVLDDMFKCFICFGEFERPVMCPCCSKVGCEDCLKKWLEDRADCPHCRAYLNAHDLVQCRFIDEIAHQLRQVVLDKKSEVQEEPTAICVEHSAAFLYFCRDCERAACPDCAVIGEKHRNHTLVHLQTVYDRRTALVNDKISVVFDLIEIYRNKILMVKAMLTALHSAKSQAERKLMKTYKAGMESISRQMDDKTSMLDAYRCKLLSDQSNIISALERLQSFKVQSLPSGIIKHMDSSMNISSYRPHEILVPDIDFDFHVDTIPPFDSCELGIQDFQRASQSRRVVHSEVLHAAGHSWRLKVYCYGNGSAVGSCLSVFLDMLYGPPGEHDFDFRLHLIAGKTEYPNDRSLIREHRAAFSVGDSIGWNYFWPLDKLEEAGFIAQGSISLRYQVRPVTLAQKCRSLSAYVDALQTGSPVEMATDLRVTVIDPDMENIVSPEYWDRLFAQDRSKLANTESMEYWDNLFTRNLSDLPETVEEPIGESQRESHESPALSRDDSSVHCLEREYPISSAAEASSSNPPDAGSNGWRQGSSHSRSDRHTSNTLSGNPNNSNLAGSRTRIESIFRADFHSSSVDDVNKHGASEPSRTLPNNLFRNDSPSRLSCENDASETRTTPSPGEPAPDVSRLQMSHQVEGGRGSIAADLSSISHQVRDFEVCVTLGPGDFH
ncbi:hypothetical protein DFJ77DRAFT_194131 [Powellomyces hirtus]|nr:hypothetical protein DFJ77DRAFT_194131 [Powellomyces hirtus]